MDWCKLHARYPDDPAINAAGEFAETLFFRGLAYLAGIDSEDGFIPEYQADKFGVKAYRGLADSKLERRIAALTMTYKVGGKEHGPLWQPVEGGWLVRTWPLWQAEILAIIKKRRQDRERKRNQRDREKAGQDSAMSRDMSADNSRDGHVPVHESVSLSHGYVSLGQVETEIEKSQTLADGADTTADTPSPAQAPGPLEEPGHSGQHPNCRACGTNQRRRGTNPRALHALADQPPRYCSSCHTTYPIRKGPDGHYLGCPTCEEANTA